MTIARRLFPLVAIVGLLAGCAPAVLGSTANPYPMGSQSISAAPGKRLYVEAHFTFADFNIDPTTLTGSMWVPSGYDAASAALTPRFSLGQERVPTGWTMSLVQVMATRTYVAPSRTIDKGTLTYTLRALIAITPKESAVAGPYHLDASLTYQKTSQPLRIDLQVR